MAVAEGEVGKEPLDDVLAVVEGAVNSQIVDIPVEHGGHLQRLDRAYASVRVQHEEAQALTAAQTLDRGTARVAAGGGHDVECGVAACQHRLEELAEKLQGHILEGQCRAVEEFQHVDRANRDHGCDFAVPEGGIAAGDHPAQFLDRQIVGIEPHHLEGEFGVRELRPLLQPAAYIGGIGGQEETAVAR